MKYVHNMQSLENDCGLAVLKTILEQSLIVKKNQNINVTLSNKGMSIYDIIKALEEFGVKSDCFEVVDIDTLTDLKAPGIAVVKSDGLSHYVVLHKFSKRNNEIVISDPSKPNIIKMSLEEFGDIFLGYVIAIEEIGANKYRDGTNSVNNIELLSSTIFKNLGNSDKVELIIIVLSQFLLPLMFYQLLQNVLSEHFEDIDNVNGLLYLIFYICFFVSSYLLSIRYSKLQLKIENTIQKRVIDEFYDLNMKNSHSKININNSLGYLTTLMQGATGLTEKFFLNIDLFFLILLIIFLGILHWSFPIIFLLISSIYLFYIRYNLSSIMNYKKNLAHKTNVLLSSFETGISGALDVKLFQKEKESKRKLESEQREFFDAKFLDELLQNKISVTSSITTFSIMLSVLLVTFISLRYSGNILYPLSSGMYVFFIIINLFESIINRYLTYQMSLISIQYVQSIRNFSIENKPTREITQALLDPFADITFDGLSFDYKEKEVLKNISLTINQGEIIAIKGENGVGKTTLTKLFLGLLTPYEGVIKLNDIEYHSLENTNILNYISYYSSEEYLYYGSVASNVSMNLFDNQFENTYYSIFSQSLDAADIVFSNGSNISQGQKQKILLDRCMSRKKSKLFILDEPTGNLDQKSKIDLINYIKGLRLDGKIVLLITHDDQLLNECDVVYSLQNGGLVGE